jgi:hypothetical protein
MDEEIKTKYNELEALLRKADEAMKDGTPAMKRRAKKQRNAINAACNAMWRAMSA